MSVPASIIEILQHKNVNYEISQGAHSIEAVPSHKDSIVVKSLILKDDNTHVQVIFPADHFVDLDAMFRQFGRQFNGIPASETLLLINENNVSSIPAIPFWKGIPTLADESLLTFEHISLESGSEGHFINVDQNSFREMLGDAKLGMFTRKAPMLNEDDTHDCEDIISSVEKFTKRRIRQRLDETLEMPPLPQTAQRIISIRADPGADISDLANAVELDPSLAAQVVSWAASPYYSAPGKVKSVHDAIVRVLGFDMVLNLALGLSLGRTISSDILNQQQVDNYWKQAIYSAAAVEGLVTSISREHRPAFGMSYLAGLLSNYGYLIMAEIFPPYFNNYERLSLANPHLPSSSIEKCLMGTTGNQIAAHLMDNWNMPKEIVVALRQQHNPDYDGEHHEYAKLVYVSNQLLTNKGLGRELPAEVPKKIYEQLHLNEEKSEETIINILKAGDDLDAIANQIRS